MRQILVNLLGNAVKFTSSGEILLDIIALENNQYRFSVIDSGNGIPLQAQKNIFEAFHQDEEGGKNGGTGLGLAIAKKQLQLMGSDLFLESEINEGSKFHFTLHLPEDTETFKNNEVKINSILHLAPGYTVKALIVDDVKENRDVLTKLLADIRVETIEAENGEEAVIKTKEHHPDIVFMDMRMPILRGDEALKLIQEEFGKDRIKIVAITASAFDHRREYYLGLGFHEYISKPFREEDVFNCLNELLDIEFIYEEEDLALNEPSQKEPQDFTQFSIPTILHMQMMNAAKLYNITQIEKTIKELGQDSAVSKQLTTHLEYLTRKYDMDGILKVMEQVCQEE